MFSDKRYNIKEERYSMDFEPSDIDSYVSRPEERPEKPLFGWEYSISVIHHLFRIHGELLKSGKGCLNSMEWNI
jgi:hypothetical protein